MAFYQVISTQQVPRPFSTPVCTESQIHLYQLVLLPFLVVPETVVPDAGLKSVSFSTGSTRPCYSMETPPGSHFLGGLLAQNSHVS